MIRMMLLLLAAAVMAVLLAGCDVITHPLQDKVQNPVSPVSEDAIVVQPVGPIPESYIYVIGQDGTNEARSLHAAENEEGAVLSPDGEKIAFLSGELDKVYGTGVIDVYVMDIDGTDKTKITSSTAYPNEIKTIRGQPAWSPDSERVAFTSYTVADTISTSNSTAEPSSAPAEEVSGIYVANASGRGDPSRIREFSREPPPVGAAPINLTWSPDGEKIAFYDGAAINVIKGDKTGQWVLINSLNSMPNLDYAKAAYSWSPGGERLAFVNKFDSDLYVTNTDGLGQSRLTETLQPEGCPAWSPDGKKIAFVAISDSDVYVIDTDGTGRKRLANTIRYSSGSNAFLAWSPDGKKIAFFCPAPPGSKGRDLCTINADGTEWKRIALKVLPDKGPLAVSWGRE